MEINDNNYELSENTPLELASNVHGLLAVKKDGSAGAVGLEEIANEAGKKVGDAVKIVGNVLPTDATVNKTAKVFGGTAGKTLTFTGGSVLIKPNYESNLIFDAVTKLWSIQDEVEQRKGDNGSSLLEVWSATSPNYPYKINVQVRDSVGKTFVSLVGNNTFPLTDKTKWQVINDTIGEKEYGYSVQKQVYNILDKGSLKSKEAKLYFNSIRWGLLKVKDHQGYEFSQFKIDDANLMSDGVTPSDLTGASGDPMVYFPDAYIKYSTDGQNEDFMLSTVPFEGADKIDAFFISMDLAVATTTPTPNLRSDRSMFAYKALCKRISYPYVETNVETRPLFTAHQWRRIVRNKGIGFEIIDANKAWFIQNIYMLYYRTVGAAAGYGVWNLNSGTWTTYRNAKGYDGVPRLLASALQGNILDAKSTPSVIPDFDGADRDITIPRVFGINNLYGYSFKLVEGATIQFLSDNNDNKHSLLYTEDPELYGRTDDWDNLGYVDNISALIRSRSFKKGSSIPSEGNSSLTGVAIGGAIFLKQTETITEYTWDAFGNNNATGNANTPLLWSTNLPFNTNNLISVLFTYQQEKNVSNLNKSKIVFLADSITANANSYFDFVQRQLRCKYVLNYACGGATWTNTATTAINLDPNIGGLNKDNNIWNQINRLIDDVDNSRIEKPNVITIVCGVNDITNGRPYGDLDADFAVDLTTITPQQALTLGLSIRYNVNILLNKWPDVKVVCTTPLQPAIITDFTSYWIGVDLMKKAFNRLSVEFIDQAYEFGIIGEREAKVPKYYSDKLHLNLVGAKYVSKLFLEKFKAILR